MLDDRAMATDEWAAADMVDWREGYAQGLREGIAMFSRMVPVFEAKGHQQFARDLMVVVSAAEHKAEAWLDENMIP